MIHSTAGLRSRRFSFEVKHGGLPMAADDVAEIERVLMAYVASYIQAEVEA